MENEEELTLVEVESDTIELEVPIKKKNKRKSKVISEYDQITTRFSDAPWAGNRTVIIGGLGGIGSNLAYCIAKIGYDMVLFDFDKVESHNIGGQMYNIGHIGMYKSSATSITVKSINPFAKINALGTFEFDLKTHEKSYNIYTVSLKTGLVFSCFDNMQARKSMFDWWKWYSIENPSNELLFVDARMYAEGFEVYAITPDRIEQYENTLFLDDEIEDLPCNFKATTHNGLMCASTMVSLMTNYITNKVMDEDLRELPFKTEFNIPMMLYETTR